MSQKTTDRPLIMAADGFFVILSFSYLRDRILSTSVLEEY